MKRIVNPLILLFLICITIISCEKNKADCPDAPANFRCGYAGGSICGVYHYSGGIFTGVSLSLNWDEVSNAEGYNVYRKGTSGHFKLEGTPQPRIFPLFRAAEQLYGQLKPIKEIVKAAFQMNSNLLSLNEINSSTHSRQSYNNSISMVG